MAYRRDHLFDKRIVTRNINQKKISKQEYEQFLGELPDVTQKAVTLFSEENRENTDEGALPDPTSSTPVATPQAEEQPLAGEKPEAPTT